MEALELYMAAMKVAPQEKQESDDGFYDFEKEAEFHPDEIRQLTTAASARYNGESDEQFALDVKDVDKYIQQLVDEPKLAATLMDQCQTVPERLKKYSYRLYCLLDAWYGVATKIFGKKLHRGPMFTWILMALYLYFYRYGTSQTTQDLLVILSPIQGYASFRKYALLIALSVSNTFAPWIAGPVGSVAVTYWIAHVLWKGLLLSILTLFQAVFV